MYDFYLIKKIKQLHLNQIHLVSKQVAEFVSADFDMEAGNQGQSDLNGFIKQIQIHQQILEKSLNIYKVKVFNTEGVVMYSPDKQDLATINTHPYFKQKVLQGEIVSKFIKFKKMSLDGHSLNKNVSEIYIPLKKEDKVIGAAEFYINQEDIYSNFQSFLNRQTWLYRSFILLLSLLGWGLILKLDKYLLKMEQTTLKVKDKNEFISNIFESITHPFYVIDANDYTIKLANKAALGNKNLACQTCYELTHHRSSPCTNDENEHHICPLEYVKKHKKPIQVEHVHFTEEGEQKFFEVNGFPIFNEKGEVIQMIESSIDITEKRQVLEENKQIQAQLLNTAKLASLGNLSSGLTHELNNPLSAVMGYSHIMKKSLNDPEKMEGYNNKIYEAATRMKKVIEHLRVFAQDSKMQKQEPLLLSKVLDDSLLLLKSYVDQLNICLEIETGKELPPIHGDSYQLENLFRILFTNSIDAFNNVSTSKQRNIWVNIQQYEQEVILLFKDNAGGIDKEIEEKVFEPYFSTKPLSEASGMGLSLAYGIVQKHKGSIKLIPVSAGETTFQIRFPIYKQNPVIKESPTLKAVRSEFKPKVLIIDDEPDVADVLMLFLEEAFDCHYIQSATETIDFIAKTSIDIIITDLEMPKMNGVNLINELKEKGIDIPVVAASGYASDSRQVKSALEAGALAFIDKPFTKPELIEEILFKILDERLKKSA